MNRQQNTVYRDHGPATGSSDAPSLPAWNLADLYDSPESPVLKADLAALEEAAKAFAASYRGRIGELDGAAFGSAIVTYEDLCERLYKILSYGQLLYAVHLDDGAIARFVQGLNEKGTDISTETLFFSLEINRLSDEVFAHLQETPAVAHYSPWLREVRLYKDHQLSDELEKAFAEKEMIGASAWTRLFDETLDGLRFEVDGKQETLTEALNHLYNPDEAVRKRAAEAVSIGLSANTKIFAFILNTLMKDKELDDRWRKYPTMLSFRHLSNQVDGDVVEALVSAVRESFPVLSHRYYALKAKWFGKDALDYWDRNAPLPGASNDVWTWPQAVDMVMGAYTRFSPQMADVARNFFDHDWIDVPPRRGKSSGAFAHSTVPSVHPYLMLNFAGKSHDVMTLAHELGHGVHQVLAAKQGTLMAGTPLTIAETASVFGEMLTFRAMVAAETDATRRRHLIARKVEDMLNTVVRQIAFHQFECRVHSERRQGELAPERISEIWLEVQGESLGPAIRFDEGYQAWWTYISHFVHSPFYVYAYAFGDCLVNSLYGVYESGMPGFEEKYLALLAAGGTLRHKELLAPFGLDATDPAFWQRGLSVIKGFIDELEAAE